MTKQEFVREVQVSGRLPGPREAERWARCVVDTLAQLAPDSETRRQFVTQLPGFLKAHLRSEPPPLIVMDREALIQHVGAALGVHAHEAQRALTTVWQVVRTAVSPGEIADFEARIPPDIAALLSRL
jgi:uncharacterized protein (DUF2267 family)